MDSMHPHLAPHGWKVYPGFPRGLPWVPVFSLVFVRFLLLRWEPRVHHFKSAWNVNDVHAFTHRVWNGMCLSQVNAHVRVNSVHTDASVIICTSLWHLYFHNARSHARWPISRLPGIEDEEG